MAETAVRSNERGNVDWLVESMARMIRPIVRFAMGRVSCSALVDLVRQIYVEEARDYLQAEDPDRRVTRSALALLCGMDGRAIKSFEDSGDRAYAPADICSEAAILETWMTDEDFTEADSDEPAELLIHGPQGTFQRLVNRAAGRAVTAQTALDRLLESGNVALNDAGTHVRLVNSSYMLVPDSEQAAIKAGSFAVNRLGKVVIHNTSRFRQEQGPWLQQDRWSLRIPRERLEWVRSHMRAVLRAQIEDIEKILEAEESRPARTVECSVGVGWYYWESQAGDQLALD
ncbi:MAG: hypothetical protein EA370_17645 [Wenzhouxiangella sp.]|nr:MAG: hypothetical protein EA370_17645 [Wenzhouxiangella sp.]